MSKSQCSKSCVTLGKGEKVNFARFEPNCLLQIEDPNERNEKIASMMEAFKTSIMKTEKQISDIKQSISTVTNDNNTLRDRMRVLDCELKASLKARELDDDYLLKQEEILAKLKGNKRTTADDKKLKNLKADTKKIYELLLIKCQEILKQNESPYINCSQLVESIQKYKFDKIS